MLTTAKSIQLLDASGMNISPITDITSLYYEVVNSKDTKIISRKYVYDAFPVGVNINPTAEVSIGTHVGTSERHPANTSLYDNGQLYKIVDASNKDILVSRVDTDIIPGTTLREIKVTNYNLSEILSYYTPLDLMDASCHALDISINNINSSIDDISTRISNLRESLDASNATLSEIIGWITNNALIPNKFYLINDYYVGDDGCMALPNSEDFSGYDSDNSLSLLVKANDATTLDGKLYEMYNNSGNALKVYGTYKLELEGGKVRITYMKDQYGNEAPYDFYNLRYNSGSGDNYYWTFTDTNDGEMNALIESGWSIENNIIKTNPFKSFKLPIFINNSLTKIINNYIGCNNIIKILAKTDLNTFQFMNNIIGNDNELSLFGYEEFILNNALIGNNNRLIEADGSTPFKHVNLTIGNSNEIYFDRMHGTQNMYIDSSNHIGLTNNNKELTTNIIFLNNNNCYDIITSDNIIIDGCDYDSETLTTSENSVYLFGQTVYAKSFNTLK